jgi:ClpX C4-type zinc finger
MLSRQLLHEARRARNRFLELQRQAEQTQVTYQHAIRRLHAAGGSMREIADALGMSYQRVHQIVDVSTGKGAVKRRVTRPDAAGEPSPDATMTCAFCGSVGTAVNKLIAGPGVFICDGCIALAREVDADQRRRANDHAVLIGVDPGDRKASCNFCGRRRDQTNAMVHAPRPPRAGASADTPHDTGASICRDCLHLCEELTGQPRT